MKKLLLVIMSILLVTGCGCNKKETSNKLEESKQNEKANIKEGIIKEQKINGLKFSNVALIYEGGSSTFTVEITNLNKKKLEINKVKIIFKDEQGNKIIELPGYVGITLEPNKSTILTTGGNVDLRQAFSVEYSL